MKSARPRALRALLAALALLAAFVARRLRRDEGRARRSSSQSHRARRAVRRAAPPIRTPTIKQGPQDGLDPQAARQPVRGVRALGHRRGAQGARRLEPHHGSDRRAARRRRSRSSTRRSSRSPTRSSSPATTPTRSPRRSSRPRSAGIKVVGMDSDVAPDARSVFVNQVTTAAGRRGPGRVDRQADRRQGRHRDPVGDGERDQPERLDQGDEGRAQEARVQGHQAREGRLRRRRRPEVLPGDPGPASRPIRTSRASSRRPRSASRPPRATCRARRKKGKIKLTGLGFPNQMRKFVKDGTVDGVPAVGPEGRRLPRRPGRRGARRRAASPARRARSSRPAGSATTRSAPTARSCSARRPTFNKDNIDDFDF